MADNISTSNVHHLETKRGRGRPKKDAAQKAAPGKAAAAAAKAEAIMRGAEALGDTPAPAKTQEEILDSQASVAASLTAPAFGANEPDESCFLKWVQTEQRDLAKIAAIKLQLKEANGERKDHRQAAKSEGIVLGDLDYAIKRAETEDVDVAAEFQRRALYCQWLGLEVGAQAELPINDRSTPELEKKHWFSRGEKAGRLGKDRGSYPDTIPPERTVDWLQGWDHGQAALMRNNPATAGAFNKDGSLKTEAEAKTAPLVADGKILVLREEHFIAGTLLEDANLKTLLPGLKEQFWTADNVTAQFGGAKRVLREPDAGEPSGFFTDTGEEDVPLTVVEPVVDEAAQFA